MTSSQIGRKLDIWDLNQTKACNISISGFFGSYKTILTLKITFGQFLTHIAFIPSLLLWRHHDITAIFIPEIYTGNMVEATYRFQGLCGRKNDSDIINYIKVWHILYLYTDIVMPLYCRKMWMFQRGSGIEFVTARNVNLLKFSWPQWLWFKNMIILW